MFAKVEVSGPTTTKKKTRFLSASRENNQEKCTRMQTTTLEKSMKYIPWKGKKEEWYTWQKTFLVRAMTRGYHGIPVGLE